MTERKRVDVEDHDAMVDALRSGKPFDCVHPDGKVFLIKPKIWHEYTVYVGDVSLCGLCGNGGIVNTIESAKWAGHKVGVRRACVCPNGRQLKRMGMAR